MTIPYPIPQQLRQSGIFLGNGGAVYSGFDFKIFDIGDVEVWTLAVGATYFSKQAVTVAKIANLPFDDFTVTFAAGQLTTTQIVVRSFRLDQRAAGVMSGTRINPDALEKEFSKISTEMQEMRRDILRAPLADFGQPSFKFDAGLADGDTIMKLGNRLVKGANALDIVAAQGYAVAANASALASAASAAAAQTFNPANFYDKTAADGRYYTQAVTYTKTQVDAAVAAALATVFATVRNQSNALTLHVMDTGNDTTGDGTFAKPFRQPKRAMQEIYNKYDCRGAPPHVLIHNSAGAYSGDIQVYGHLPGCSYVYIDGETAGNVTIVAAAGACLKAGDLGNFIAQNLRLVGSGANGETAVALHQHCITDFNGGMSYGDFPAGFHFANDTGPGIINIQDNYTVFGSAAQHVHLNAGGNLIMTGGKSAVWTGTRTLTSLYALSGAGCNLQLGGGPGNPCGFSAGGLTISSRAVQIEVGNTAYLSGSVLPTATSANGGGGNIVP